MRRSRSTQAKPSSSSSIAENDAAIYCRVSSDRQKERGSSLGTQLDSNTAYADKMSLNVRPEHIISVAESAKNPGRAEFENVLNFVRSGAVKHKL